MGFENFRCGFKQVEPGRTVHSTAIYKGKRYQLEIRNPHNENKGEPKILEPVKCEVVGVRINDIMSLGLGNTQIVLPENINIMETTIDNMIENWGKYTEKHSDNTYVWTEKELVVEITVDNNNRIVGLYISTTTDI